MAVQQYCIVNRIPFSITQVPEPGLDASNAFNAKLSQNILEHVIEESKLSQIYIYNGQ